MLRASLEVRRRNQYYLWLQGQVQSVIPHELMVCVHGYLATHALVTDLFSSYPIPDLDVALPTHPQTGLAVQAVRA